MTTTAERPETEGKYDGLSPEELAERGIGMLSIADPSGDTRIMWDPRIDDEVKVAKEAFHKAKKKGMLAYAVDENSGEKTGTVLTEFDPEAGKVIMTKQLQGG